MTDSVYDQQLRSALRMTADNLDRTAADWQATVANQTLHTPPGVARHAASTARAFGAAADLVRGALRELEAPDEAKPYTRGEILYVVTLGDAEGYLAGKLGEDVPEAIRTDFARLLKRTIDLDEGHGMLLEAGCDVAYERLLQESPAAAALELEILAAEAEAD